MSTTQLTGRQIGDGSVAVVDLAGGTPTSGQVLTATSSSTMAWQTPTGITGLTTNYITQASSATTITNSPIYNNGGSISINSTNSVALLDVYTSANTNVGGTSSAMLALRGNFHFVGYYGGIRFGDYTQTTDYQKGGIFFESTSGAANGKLHFALENTGGTGTVALADAKMTILPSGEIGINTQTPRTKLEIAGDGAILAVGTFGAGFTEPGLGAGTRMLWYPRKSAFRVGTVTSTQWDNTNIGNYSVAMGYNNTASGIYSTSIGAGNSSTGAYSFSSGFLAVATATATIAMGYTANAVGAYSTAIGYQAYTGGQQCVAIGASAFTDGTVNDAMALGTNSAAYAAYSTAIAGGQAQGQFAIALGGTTTADYATALGIDSVAYGIHSVAIGSANSTYGDSALAAGDSSTATGDQSVAIGNGNNSNGANSLALNSFATANGDYSSAIGRGTTAFSFSETALGTYNTTYTPASTTAWNASDRLLNIGNGASGAALSDAVTILKNGNVGINSVTPGSKLEVTDGYTYTSSSSTFSPIFASSVAGTYSNSSLNLIAGNFNNQANITSTTTAGITAYGINAIVQTTNTAAAGAPTTYAGNFNNATQLIPRAVFGSQGYGLRVLNQMNKVSGTSTVTAIGAQITSSPINCNTVSGLDVIAGGGTQFNTAARFTSTGTGAGVMSITDSGSVAFANSASVLDLQSTSKGFLPPRMTGTQVTAIVSPPQGLVVYNTTTNKLNYYTGALWVPLTPSVNGSATLSGTGAATSFTIAHGLGTTPVYFNVTPTNAAAAGITYMTADATNITINYAVAPASGTNNLTFVFKASL